MTHDINSPNDMVMDTDDYINVADEPEKVAIINPDNLEPTEVDQLQDLPVATDHEAMKEICLPPLIDEPKILGDYDYTWTVENWRSLNKKEHGPIFQAGGFPWRILLFPHGNNIDQCSIYLEHGFEADSVPDNWSCCVQFALVLWNPNDPSLYVHHTAHHRFTKEEGDWGFTRFVEHRRMFNVPWEGSSRPLCENDTANITAYIRLAIYEIPTEADPSMHNSAYTLQRLFYQLQTSDQAVGTTELTKSFGWDTRHIFEQQDVQEFSRKLMERMEEKMKGTPAQSVLPEMFSGKIKTYISCINVDYESSRIEDFWDIQLNVSGNKNLLESFEDYVQVEKMDGENQYFAGDQHKLQDANKGVIFNSFPDVLHLQLKRFEYDIQRDTMMKINDRYEFPEFFDAAPYLADDADKSVPWTYQLHSVLVHSGDLNAGHYYAFLKPEKDGWFYKYDDDKVTKATLREVMEENFGGEYHAANGYPRAPVQKKAPIMRQNSAYMLVYIRQSRLDDILCPVTKEHIPLHLRQKFEEETVQREARKKEQREAHLYMWAKVITDYSFQQFGGTDLCQFDANPEVDPAAPKFYRVRRAMTMEEFVAQVASDMGEDPRRVRLWLMVNRQNKTIRPDQPIMDLRPTVDETYSRSAAHRDTSLRVWAEVAEEVDADGEPIWPSYQSQPNGVIVKNDTILLLLKHFDIDAQTLRGVGHVYISKEKKVEDVLPMILKKMGWGEKLPAEEKLLLWEEIKPTMIEPLKPKQSLKVAELQDGDIICFQRTKAGMEKRVGDKASQESNNISDHFEDAREYYDFLEHRRTVKFHPHPTRCDQAQYPPFELDTYDLLVPKTGTIEDLVEALIKKAQIPSEAEGGRLRIYETSSNRFYREPLREHPVINLNEYATIYAERVPQEELNADESQFTYAFHFQNDVSRVHGVPFKFLVVEGETFADTKKRLEKRSGIKGKSFEKIKIAVVRRANYSKPQYLNDGS
ncbi:Ubiquitin thiolesterase [Fusarium acuminatum]|uniref:Ubiquitin thiolesterase n=1 Tax=Fusarium acuminatum TaxID=5515 RepID=A0ABZ2WWA6_9HYPO